MKTFFILSLPRSRTAWLSNFLTYENSFCFHEGLMRVGTAYQLEHLFECVNKPIVGNSDCGNLLFMDEIAETFPDASYVLIERPYDEVINSMHAMGPSFTDDRYVQKAARLMESAKRYLDPLIVDYHELNRDACRRIWRHCIGTPFDTLRWQILDGINIQIDPDRKLEELRDGNYRIQNLMEGLH